MRLRDVACALVILGAAAAGIHGGTIWSPVGPALAAGERATDREGFLRESERRLEQWGRELDRLGRDVERKGAETGRDAQRLLERALDDVRKHLRALQDAGAAGWKEALEAYERSLREYEQRRTEADITDT